MRGTGEDVATAQTLMSLWSTGLLHSSGMPKEPYIKCKRDLCYLKRDLLTLSPRSAYHRKAEAALTNLQELLVHTSQALLTRLERMSKLGLDSLSQVRLLLLFPFFIFCCYCFFSFAGAIAATVSGIGKVIV